MDHVTTAPLVRTEIVRTTVPGEYALHRALLAERQTGALPLDDEATRKIARELYRVIWNEAVDHCVSRYPGLEDLRKCYQLRLTPEPEREEASMGDQPEPEPEHDYAEDPIPVTEPGETTTDGDSREDGHR